MQTNNELLNILNKLVSNLPKEENPEFWTPEHFILDLKNKHKLVVNYYVNYVKKRLFDTTAASKEPKLTFMREVDFPQNMEYPVTFEVLNDVMDYFKSNKWKVSDQTPKGKGALSNPKIRFEYNLTPLEGDPFDLDPKPFSDDPGIICGLPTPEELGNPKK